MRLKKRLRYAVAAAVLATPMLVMGTAQPASAATFHTVTLTGDMHVYNSAGIFKYESTGDFHFERHVTLTHDHPDGTLSYWACEGGETRGVLTVDLHLNPWETVTMAPRLQLFEGSSCSSGDLDGEQYGLERGFLPGETRTWYLKAVNGEILSGDMASVNFKLTHSTSSLAEEYPLPKPSLIEKYPPPSPNLIEKYPPSAQG
ncbi:hypothetical protein GCM10020367_27200 [Streptomyces sannanensis]|uniref:Uncharacterized protein n=1 Tax=Streptomyces sannanensis TaxID=285536 RepID=A0ABP6SAV0_9ACTN